MFFGEEGREAKKTKCMASTRGTESLTACSTRAATTGLHRPRLGQKLVGERGTHIPAIVCTTSERSMEFIRIPNGVASVAQATSEFGFKTLIPTEEEFREVLGLAKEDVDEEGVKRRQRPQKLLFKGFKLKVGNASLKRLLSGAIAGAVSRTAVAPLETIRTHLMVGLDGQSTVTGVFQNIMQREGWQGLFRGNGINVLRVAPSKAIELFAYDTVKTFLTPEPGQSSLLPIPASSVAGASAGVCSTLCMYPLELLKTRLTIQHGVYDNLLHAFIKICKEEGPRELYRGLCPSLIGVVPYAAINYFSYDTLRKTYRRLSKQDKVGNIETLLMGSIAGAVASSATFPLEVARKQMQVGRISGRQVYKNMFHALTSILEQQGPEGLYRGLGASCIKIIPAAGISFMCYEACKQILIEQEKDTKS